MNIMERPTMSKGEKAREWVINPKTGYIRDADYEGRTWGEHGNDNAVRIHVIEYSYAQELEQECEELKKSHDSLYRKWEMALRENKKLEAMCEELAELLQDCRASIENPTAIMTVSKTPLSKIVLMGIDEAIQKYKAFKGKVNE